MLFFLTLASAARGEIDRIYHPYVEQQEREIEYGFLWRNPEHTFLHRLSAGYAWNDRFFGEIYFITESFSHDNEQLRGYELELKWQLTEQGEYWADWGLLFEAGASRDTDSRDLAVGLLWEKEIANRWVAATNLILEYEYGESIEDEFESAFRAQLLYRNSKRFSPALEVYLDDQDCAAGPAFTGEVKLSGKKKILWELGLLFGLDKQTPETNLRGGLELEF
jgi:hypothetical protein